MLILRDRLNLFASRKCDITSEGHVLQKLWPGRSDVSTTCVSRWVKAHFNRNESVFDPSAYADGTDLAADETLEAKPEGQRFLIWTVKIIDKRVSN